ncbi:MAG: PD-(D/E)XK motif protein [Clostridiaceae bacterium]|nr:PD-(D/E)XK motif protein [Clostridiaceae bacterium]
MDSMQILDKINTIVVSEGDYCIFNCDEGKSFFGKDKDNNAVFILPSYSVNTPSITQETKSLKFALNRRCTFLLNGSVEIRILHLLTCKEQESEKLLAFIRLTRAFSVSDAEKDQYFLAKLFSSISALFEKKIQVSEMELQGLFAELYAIMHFMKLGCDIGRNWQSMNKMKFDFSISEKKRIEVKSTLKQIRSHHFKHEQLLSELYDIKIVSMLLRKNDYGISLGDMIKMIREHYQDNYPLLIHIESLVFHIDQEQLNVTKYDEVFLKENIKYFDAKDVPHFNEKTPDGVYNAEYDCTLDSIPSISECDMLDWIGGYQDV